MKGIIQDSLQLDSITLVKQIQVIDKSDTVKIDTVTGIKHGYKYNYSILKAVNLDAKENMDSIQQAANLGMLDSIFESKTSAYDTQTIREPINKIALVNEKLIQSGNAYKEPIDREIQNEGLTAIILLVIFFLLGVTMYFEGKKLKQFYKAIVSLSYANILKRDDKTFSKRSIVLSSIIFLLSLGLYIYNSMEYYNYKTLFLHKSFLFVFIIVSLLTVYAIKIFTIKVLGFVFEIRELVSNYIFNILLFNISIGIILFPVSVLHSFTYLPKGILLSTSLTVIIILFTFRLLRSIYASFQQGYFISYIFLYFCALEILPLIVLIKTLIIQ